MQIGGKSRFAALGKSSAGRRGVAQDKAVRAGRKERRSRHASHVREKEAWRMVCQSRQGRKNVAHHGSGVVTFAWTIKPRRGGTRFTRSKLFQAALSLCALRGLCV
jgi:hypothetical protein